MKNDCEASRRGGIITVFSLLVKSRVRAWPGRELSRSLYAKNSRRTSDMNQLVALLIQLLSYYGKEFQFLQRRGVILLGSSSRQLVSVTLPLIPCFAHYFHGIFFCFFPPRLVK